MVDVYFKTDAKCFPGGSDGKESACNAGDYGPNPGVGRSPEGMAIHSNNLAGRIPGTEETAGYNPWGHKELDTTERLHFLSL